MVTPGGLSGVAEVLKGDLSALLEPMFAQEELCLYLCCVP